MSSEEPTPLWLPRALVPEHYKYTTFKTICKWQAKDKLKYLLSWNSKTG